MGERGDMLKYEGGKVVKYTIDSLSLYLICI